MKTSDFDYELPPELIGQTPVEPRDSSRLLALDRRSGIIEHRHFFEIIDCVKAGDVLVFNDSRVIPARLNANKPDSEGKLEILLLRRLEPNVWETLVKPAKRAKVGTKIGFSFTRRPLAKLTGEIVGAEEDGIRLIRFSNEELLYKTGKIPLPPYIHEKLANKERYQTVYSRISGSVAAPTAGLHFTAELIDSLRKKGVECLFVTLHVGLDTFRPVREEDPLKHIIHKEYGVLTQETAEKISLAKAEKRRVIAVGTTSVRLLEAAAQAHYPLQAFSEWTDLFILPGYKFQMVDAMITNYHLPKTTLLMLVSAFAGKDLLKEAYQKAIAEKYRFYSFGDAMLIF
ncbi:MAG: tRNA preQ1(34) S-adenosylmethionine ribosyltransferase-isomerase QueA [Dehalococcoidales bacterium]|nr:tRNA preQ1(34) S-adenosylmethionine ribosyltransferase-isomerase QueA [Dehalococcoidales bacterium]